MVWKPRRGHKIGPRMSKLDNNATSRESKVLSTMDNGVRMSHSARQTFTCPHCRKRFQWTTKIADRKAQCPSCHKRIRIPTVPGRVAEAVDPLPEQPKPEAKDESNTYELDLTGIDETIVEPPPTPAQQAAAQTGRCPACNQSIKPGAVICIKCGYNLKKGKRMQTAVTDPDAPVDTSNLPGGGMPGIGSSSVLLALEEGEDDATDNKWQDVLIPAILLAVGLLWRVGVDILADGHGTGYLIARTAIEALFVLPIMFIGTILIAMIMSTTFGSLLTTLMKLAAIIVAPEIFGDLMTLWLGPFAWHFPGIFLVAPIYFGLYFWGFSGLFDLDPTEASVATALMFITNFMLRAALTVFCLPYLFSLFP